MPKSSAHKALHRRRRRLSRAPSSKLRHVLWLCLPTLIVLLLLLISTRWYLPTRIQADMTTRRVVFLVGGGEPREILNASVEFSSLVIEDCAEVTFKPESLEVADPEQLVPGEQPGETGHYPESAWRAIETEEAVRLRCRDDGARVTLRPPGPANGASGALDRVRASPGSRVALEVPSGLSLDVIVEVDGEHSLAIPIYGDREIVLVTDLVEIEGANAPPFPGDLLTYRVRLAETDPTVRLRSRARHLSLVATPAGSSTDELFSGRAIPLDGLELYEQGLEGVRQTSLLAPGELHYPGFEIDPVEVAQDELVGFGDLGLFRLEELTLDPENRGLKLRLDGVVGKALTTDEAFPVDRRLSVFQRFQYSSLWNLIAVVAVWTLSTTWAGYELWKKIRDDSA